MADEIKTTAAEAPESRNFIHTFIEEDIAQGGQFEGMTVHTRFPPEPNGYLHIGHCKALTIDFGTAEKFGGLCNLRMDDTNPTKEDEEFVEAIKEDIHWLGFDWGDRFFYGSDYFEEDYRQAVEPHQKGPCLCVRAVSRGVPGPPGRHRRSCHVSLPGPSRGGESGSVRPDAGRGVPQRFHDPAGQDRPGQRQLQYAGPGYLPDQPHAPSPSGGQVVHLSHVRLRPSHSGRAGGHYPQPVLPGI